MTAPCGVPSSVTIKRPSSSTPAVSHLAISRMIRRSPIRCSMNRISQDWLTLSKKDWTSQSSTQLIVLRRSIPGLRLTPLSNADVFRPTEGEMVRVVIARYEPAPRRRKPWHAQKSSAWEPGVSIAIPTGRGWDRVGKAGGRSRR